MHKIETQEQFNEFIDEIIPQQLFHITPTDKNEDGIRLDELTLLGLLNSNPEALKFMSLADFVKNFIEN